MTSLIRKALQPLVKASRGSLSSYVPHTGSTYGQPPQVTQDIEGLITPQRQREMAQKSPTLAGCMNAVLDYVSSVELRVRNVDPATLADPDRVRYVQQFLITPNEQDTDLHFKQKIFRDMFVLGHAAAEIEWDSNHKPANLYTLDMGRLRIDSDEHGTVNGFKMFDIEGRPISWQPEDVIYFKPNASSDSVYSSSHLSQAFALAWIELLMLDFIGRRFTDSNVPYGILDLGDISEIELQRAVEKWNDQQTSAHQILLTGSKGGSKWTPFAYNLNELEATNLLHDIQGKIMGILGVTKNEFGDSQDVSKSNGYNLSYTFKKRAIEPVLNEYCRTMTVRFLWKSLGWNDIELYYQEIDSRDELLQAQIDEVYLRNGVVTFNQVRNRRGDTSVDGGDEPFVQTGSAWLPLRLVAAFAEAQLAGIEAMVAAETATASGGGADGGPVKPAMIRPPQSPIRFTTPDGVGSSTPKFSYPKTPTTAPQAARGGIQKLRNTGNRQAGKND